MFSGISDLRRQATGMHKQWEVFRKYLRLGHWDEWAHTSQWISVFVTLPQPMWVSKWPMWLLQESTLIPLSSILHPSIPHTLMIEALPRFPTHCHSQHPNKHCSDFTLSFWLSSPSWLLFPLLMNSCAFWLLWTQTFPCGWSFSKSSCMEYTALHPNILHILHINLCK